MATSEDCRRAIAVRYIAESEELEIVLEDSSRHLIPVSRLEMVEETPNAFVPIRKPSKHQLSDVKVWGGGASVYWESIGQIFLVEELIAGIYGRPAWMESLMVAR
jgi:hypothetical protein